MNLTCRLVMRFVVVGAIAFAVSSTACAPSATGDATTNAGTQSVIHEPSIEKADNKMQGARVNEKPERFSANNVYLRNGLRFETATLNIKHKKRELSIAVTYPQLVGNTEETAREQAFNRAVRRFFESEMKQLAPDERDLEKEKSRWADTEETVGGGYEINYASDEIISVVFSVYIAPWGAAGGRGYPYVFIYDLQHGKKLNPHDIFSPRSGYERTLLNYCEPKLIERHGGGFSYMSFAERAREYKHFGITKEGINVIFPEYTFAPGSAGVHSVFVPYSVIKDKLNPSSPVASTAGVTEKTD